MNDKALLGQPGEHSLMLAGECGDIEAVLTIPQDSNKTYCAILGHPHSLQGGTMNNKVVTTLVRSFRDLRIPSLRFNFRGVGASAGEYDEGVGESQDLLLLAYQVQKILPDVRFIFAGFSFGSYVTYRAACRLDAELLISIAPPVHHYNYSSKAPKTKHWLIIQGDDDEVVPYDLVLNFCREHQPEIPNIVFEQTGHFFHGKLIALKQSIIDAVSERLDLISCG